MKTTIRPRAPRLATPALALTLLFGASCASDTRALRQAEPPAPWNAPQQQAEQPPEPRRERRPRLRAPAPLHGGAIEIGLGLGVRRQNEEELWGEADDLFSYFALDLSAQPPRWPVELTTRLTGASVSEEPAFAAGFSDEVDRVDLFEVDFGLRVPIDLGGGSRAHIGGGVAWVEVTVSEDNDYWFDEEIDDDGDLGWWAGGGVALPLGGGHALGFDARWTEADVELEGREVETDAWTLLLTWTWRRSLE